MTTNITYEHSHEPLANYLRTHRLKTGFTQDEVAGILRFVNRDMISRHERQDSIPSLLIALSYESFYRVQVSEIFAGLSKTVQFNVEEQLVKYEAHLGERSAAGPRAAATARKLEWLSERRSPGYK